MIFTELREQFVSSVGAKDISPEHHRIKDMNYVKNQTFTVKVTDMSDNGEGIGRINGYTLFIKDAIIGDVVLARLTKVKKSFAYARCEQIITPSSKRIEPACRSYRQCGGCQIQAMSYEAQLVFKESKVRNDLIRIGGFDGPLVDSVMEGIIGCDGDRSPGYNKGFRYRNKAQFPVGTDKEGRIICGFYAGRTHSIIPNTDCLLGAEENREILEKVLNRINKFLHKQESFFCFL